MEQAAAHPLDPNMSTYDGPDPHGLWWKQEPWTSTSTTDPDMALGGSPGPDATMASGGKQVSHSPFLVAFASLHPPLSTGRERLCLFFPATPLHMFAHSMPMASSSTQDKLPRRAFLRSSPSLGPLCLHPNWNRILFSPMK